MTKENLIYTNVAKMTKRGKERVLKTRSIVFERGEGRQTHPNKIMTNKCFNFTTIFLHAPPPQKKSGGGGWGNSFRFANLEFKLFASYPWPPAPLMSV